MSTKDNMAAMCCNVEEIENAVLGALLLESGMTARLLPMVRPGMFYHGRNRLVFEAISSAFRKDRPVDILVVTEELKEMGKLEEAGGAYAVTRLLGGVCSSAHFQEHCLILYEYQVRRELARLLSAGLLKCGDMTCDVFDTVMEMQAELGRLLEDSPTETHLRSMEEVVDMTLALVDRRVTEGKDGVTGIPTGVPELDAVTGGWQPGNLILTAARPGVGKTQLDLKMALKAAEEGYKVLFFTLEMMSTEVGERLVLMDTPLDFRRVRRGLMSKVEVGIIHHQGEKIKSLPLYIDDTPYISVDQVCGIAKRMKAKSGLDMVVVDYLQLMGVVNVTGKTREQEVAECTRKLKALARSLECPVIVSSQLNRQVGNSYGRKPELHHLRESGAIEQDADIVVMLYKPETDTDAECRLLVEKNRHGGLIL